MSTWLEGVLGAVASGAVLGLLAGFWKGLNGLKENTLAIRALERTLSDMKAENNKAFDQQNLRIADLETWRTAVTASLFRVAGGSGN